MLRLAVPNRWGSGVEHPKYYAWRRPPVDLEPSAATRHAYLRLYENGAGRESVQETTGPMRFIYQDGTHLSMIILWLIRYEILHLHVCSKTKPKRTSLSKYAECKLLKTLAFLAP
jgi:hypothetical protein